MRVPLIVRHPMASVLLRWSELSMQNRVLFMAAILGAVCAMSAPKEGRAQGQPQTPPPPPRPVIRAPVQWWCEVYAQPASSVTLNQDEKDRNFFFSQIFARSHPARGDDETIERRCRTSFEVQFGGRWTLVTARAMSAPTLDEAISDRVSDQNNSVRRGHTRDFRMPED
jgi:hypothetical protein